MTYVAISLNNQNKKKNMNSQLRSKIGDDGEGVRENRGKISY